ncbi:hypothetical protein G7Z17_g3125 [Cylindrodendrum hubeiense]|uniref:Major facilitator superfamily (MFS) profile domain-containing protein n=1 Tax=Cylindrodendrum hubeiense TaxID=595255 RepID=A0A9P5HD15_9HYPO|nr:hypothetical protein G7Z17_g3125 [Cylindrodendrum hubeiense]
MHDTGRKVPSEDLEQAAEGYGATPFAVSDADSRDWDPTKLSWPRKLHVLMAGIICSFNGSVATSISSGALDAIAEHFSVTQRVQLTLLNSLTMVGFVLGPPFFGPMSEYIGRRPVLIGSFLGYLVFTLACSWAPNYAALLVFRLLCGINAAAPLSVVNGLCADILDNPSQRGIAIAIVFAANTIGAVIAPTISGSLRPLSWNGRTRISPILVISLFWLGWTVWDSVSPVVPAFGGLFFGIGFQLLFISMLNFITDVFRQHSASAHAGASCLRSIGAILVPLAADSMYRDLGIHWAPSVLGFISLAMGVIPFVFIRYGETLTRRSQYAHGI